jgi:hypothetical protein
VTDPLRPTKAGIRLQFDSFSEDRRFVLTYDAAAPANGFSVTSTRLK